MTKQKDLQPDLQGIEIEADWTKNFTRCTKKFIEGQIDTNLCHFSTSNLDNADFTLSLGQIKTLFVIFPLGFLIALVCFILELFCGHKKLEPL